MGKNVIFISMLGASQYDKVKYYYKDENNSCETSYVQAAILHLLEDKPTNSFILLTCKARKVHWEELKKQINDFGPNDISISEDFDKLWKLLETLTQKIPDGAELILDITHSFRYMPMFLLILADYLRTLKKNITIRKVLYGKYEREAKKHPIIDVTGLIRLQNWIRAVSVFNEYGRHELLQSLLQDWSDTPDTYENNIKTLKQAIANMSLYIATCRGDKILKGIHVEPLKPLRKFERKLQENSEHGEFSVIHPLLGKVVQKLETLKNANGEELKSVKLLISARWAFEHKMYQQSITLLREGIISWIMEKCGEKEILNKDRREKYNSILNKLHWKIESFEGENKEKISKEALERIFKEVYEEASDEVSKKIMEKIMETFGGELIELLKLLQNIKNDRNLINHAFMKKIDWGSTEIIERLQAHLHCTGKLLGIEQLEIQVR